MAQSKKDHRVVIFGEEARKALLRGAKIMADTVGLSYGPKGANIGLEKTYGRPIITRDGVSISREVYSEIRDENMGMQFLNESAQATVQNVGDGTTQTILLAYQLIQLGLQKIGNGANPMEVKKEILDDSYKILDNLKSMGKQVKKGQLEQVATVSSTDENLGKLIAEAVEKVGSEGGLITEKAPIEGVEREYVEGYYLQQGFTAITEGKKELENPYIVISSKLLSSRIDAITLINKVGELAHEDQGLPLSQGGQPVPLKEPIRIGFFGEIDGEAFNFIVANINNGAFDGTITKTPPMGDMGAQYLDDLAVYCGGKPIRAGDNLSNVDTSFIGRAEKVSCTASETTIFGGEHSIEDISKRKADLKDRIKDEKNEAIVEKIKDRLAKLENKIALFRIGGATETEREEKEFRIEDAIQSTRAAANYGVVTGGGITLLKLSQTKDISDTFKTALQNVFKKLIDNAALSADVKLKEALDAPSGYGFNLKNSDELVNLEEEGILDPTLVVEEVIKNSASTAANVVSMGALITFIDRKED